MIKELKWTDFKSFITSKQLEWKVVAVPQGNMIELLLPLSGFFMACTVQGDDLTDFETNFSNLVNSQKGLGAAPSINEPFSSKKIGSKSVFRRVHGISQTVDEGLNNIDFVVPYNFSKINEVSLVGCEHGDKVDLEVYDTPTGTISTVPNYKLNQFAFDVVLPNGTFRERSDYDADLIKDLKVRVVYKRNQSTSILIGVNLILHEII